ncbi:Major facilitator superfamily domain-containing protein 12 [Porites harrisoni]
MGISKLCCHNSESGLNSRTPVFQRFACGVGHVMNDITRQLLFSFRLVIFMQVFGLSAANAGWLMLYGLISVAASSAIGAFLIDNVKIPYLSKTLGKRKAWHLIGTVLGAIVIPFYFSSCFLCQSDQGQWQLMIYIPVLNTILSFSFGLMEISHLSIIPAIAKDQSEAVELNAWRTAFSFLSGIVTFIVAWLIIGQDSSDHISAENSMDFTVLTLILIGISLLSAVIFHVGTKEPSEESAEKLSKNEPMSEESKMDKNSESPGNIVNEENGIQGTNIGIGATDFKANSSISIEHLGVDNTGYKGDTELGVPALETNQTKGFNLVTSGDLESALPVSLKPKTVRAWLKDPHLYKVAIIFTCAMSVISQAYAYLPLFLIYRVQFGKWCFVLAALFVITAGVWFYFITKSNRVMTYPATVLLGFGFSAMLVNALSFAAELIGDNKSTSGVVFSFMSLMSYLTSGTLITTIQNLFPEGSNAENCNECGDYVRHVFSFVPGSLAAISLLVVLLFHASKPIYKENASQTVSRRTIVDDTRL